MVHILPNTICLPKIDKLASVLAVNISPVVDATLAIHATLPLSKLSSPVSVRVLFTMKRSDRLIVNSLLASTSFPFCSQVIIGRG